MTTVSVFGGTGFLGRRLVRRLVAEGATVRVVVRRSDRAQSALRAAGLEQVMVCGADVRNQASVAAAVAGADAVVNAVSAYVEKGDMTFESVHERGAGTVAREAAAARVARLVLVSGIGANPEAPKVDVGRSSPAAPQCDAQALAERRNVGLPGSVRPRGTGQAPTRGFPPRGGP